MNFRLFLIISLLSFGVFGQNITTYTYAIKGKDTLKMDVYKPANLKANESKPVMLFMHGGGFSGGGRDYPSEKKFANYMAENGYIGISISYRLTRKNDSLGFGCKSPKSTKIQTFKDAAVDYLDAAEFIYKNSKKLNADTSKIIAAGSSAGAEAVLSAVYLRDFYFPEDKRYNDIKFAGVLSLAGAVVNANYINQTNAIPTYMVHGTQDSLVPFAKAPHHYCSNLKPGYLMLDGSSIIANRLGTTETAYYLYVIKGGGHEAANIPFAQLDDVLEFFKQTSFNKQVTQTREFFSK